MRRHFRVLALRARTLIALAAIVVSCVDKQPLSPITTSDVAVIRLSADFVAQVAPATRTLDIKVGYDRTSGERVVLADTLVALASGTQALTISADLRRCLDDRARVGTPTSCPLRVVVTLLSASGVTLDTKDLGPFDAAPGRAPIEVSATLTIVATVVITPGSTNVPLNGTAQYTATAKDAQGNALAERLVTWTSSNPAVASVSITGLVTGIAAGTATITAASGGTTGTAALTVGALGVGFGLDQFALIPAGSFQMGSNTGSLDEQPVHTVTISRAFYLQKTEVTNGQWLAVMGANPSYFSSCGDTCPVEMVSWDDIQTFLQRLNASTPGVTYRLPTEAEWEYAARAGTTGDTYGTLDAIAWNSSNSSSKTHPAAGKQANAWGLYDMIGNVWEWVNDWYDSGYYAVSPSTDPPGPTSGASRVLRGGSWDYDANYARSAHRGNSYPSYRTHVGGFRLAVTASNSVATVTVAPSSTAIDVGKTATFTATERDPTGNPLSGRTFVWSSAPTSIATVTQSGVATGVAAGTATITATADGIAGTATLTVAPPVAAVTVSPSTASISSGASQQFTASLMDASGNTLTGRTVIWSTSNATIATVSATGLVTGVTAGSLTITATSEGRTGTAAVSVTAVPTTGGISGVVQNATNGLPLSGVLVEIRAGSATTGATAASSVTTSATGAFSFTNLAAGIYTVLATATGFAPVNVAVTVIAGQTQSITIALSPLGPTGNTIEGRWAVSMTYLSGYAGGPNPPDVATWIFDQAGKFTGWEGVPGPNLTCSGELDVSGDNVSGIQNCAYTSMYGLELVTSNVSGSFKSSGRIEGTVVYHRSNPSGFNETTTYTFVMTKATGTVQGTISYSGAATPSATRQLVVIIYPFSNTNMQGPPNGSTIQFSVSSTSPFTYSFAVPPGDYHLCVMLDANGDGNFNSGNTDPYLIYTPNNSAGTGTFGTAADKFTVAAGQTLTVNVSFGDTYKK